MLVDLRPKKLTGKIAQESLDKAGITANKNLIPYDPEKPLVTSGIRLGTPAVTTRGMKEAEMEQIAALITEVLEKPDDVGIASQREGQSPRPDREVPAAVLSDKFESSKRRLL